MTIFCGFLASNSCYGSNFVVAIKKISTSGLCYNIKCDSNEKNYNISTLSRRC